MLVHFRTLEFTSQTPRPAAPYNRRSTLHPTIFDFDPHFKFVILVAQAQARFPFLGIPKSQPRQPEHLAVLGRIHPTTLAATACSNTPAQPEPTSYSRTPGIRK